MIKQTNTHPAPSIAAYSAVFSVDSLNPKLYQPPRPPFCLSVSALPMADSVLALVWLQALLEGISLSQPQPKLPSELIKFLGKTYNAWHIAIPLLESHVVLFPHVSCHPDITTVMLLHAKL